MCVQEEERLKAKRIDHINQFKHSKNKRYKKLKIEYTKPKPVQFKNNKKYSNPNKISLKRVPMVIAKTHNDVTLVW